MWVGVQKGGKHAKGMLQGTSWEDGVVEPQGRHRSGV